MLLASSDLLCRVSVQMKQRWILLAVAPFGLVVPNNKFLHASLHDPNGCGDVGHNLLASSFILDAFLAMGCLAYFFAVSPSDPSDGTGRRFVASRGHGIWSSAVLVAEL